MSTKPAGKRETARVVSHSFTTNTDAVQCKFAGNKAAEIWNVQPVQFQRRPDSPTEL